jgi:pimeloyl-ACP methyl ester carboxylesterase
MPLFRRSTAMFLLAATFGPWGPTVVAEDFIRLKNGLQVRGDAFAIAGLGEDPLGGNPGGGEVDLQPIVVIDDKLRRMYVHRAGMVAGQAPVPPEAQEKFELYQPSPQAGRPIGAILGIRELTPLNAFGRRTLEVVLPDGPQQMVQGITEITPRYLRLEAISRDPPLLWDMRLATSAVPAELLRDLLHGRLDMDQLDTRLQLVNFFGQAKRYDLARRELEAAIEAFPALTDQQGQVRELVQRQALQLLEEVELRRDAGQRQLARSIAAAFPQPELAAETRLRVKRLLDEIAERESTCQALVTQLATQIAQLPADAQGEANELVAELRRDLNPDTLGRLNDYERLGGATELAVENRVALAFGGWLLGPASGLQNLAEARSLWRSRPLVMDYLGETTTAVQRQQLLSQLQAQEGLSPERLTQMIALIEPPLPAPPAAADPAIPGLLQGTVASPDGESPVEYLVQLPPEYSPLRKYPCVITLAPAMGSPQRQIDWWCGPHQPSLGIRAGVASRYGYIVIAPKWADPETRSYTYTPREHASVLRTLRDACRRLSIDTDRVFLSGHDLGSSAAWDIGLAHPDLWAGLVLINGEADKFVRHYHPNGKYVPMYFVTGEIAGSPSPLKRNGINWDAYMRPRYDVMVTMYRGRGPDHFLEELPRIIEWCELRSHRRAPPPREIEVSTMRATDSFFWWIEMSQLKERTTINPILYDYTKSRVDGVVKSSITDKNSVKVGSLPADGLTVFLSPNMGLDLRQRVTIDWSGGRDAKFDYDDDLGFILDDVRARADRQRPFWAAVVLR